MNLDPFTRRVLVTVARDQFDEYLQGIFGEIKGWHKGMPEEEELKLTQEAARKLIDLGLATFWRWKNGPGGPHESIPPQEADPILYNSANWYPRDEADREDFFLDVTPAGLEEYRRGDPAGPPD